MNENKEDRSSPGPVIHHAQEDLEDTSCGILSMTVQDEVFAFIITATSVRVLIKPANAHKGRKGSELSCILQVIVTCGQLSSID